jgi:Rrf2 family protein
MTNHILKISEAASLGLHTMAYLAANPKGLVSTAHIAQVLDVSEAHLAKVLQRLGHVGLVTASRGPKGGFLLARGHERINLLEVYEAIEGPLPEATCLLGKNGCTAGRCVLGSLVGRINQQVREYLTETRLSEMADIYRNKQRPETIGAKP